jgi:hypothetical protein
VYSLYCVSILFMEYDCIVFINVTVLWVNLIYGHLWHIMIKSHYGNLVYNCIMFIMCQLYLWNMIV